MAKVSSSKDKGKAGAADPACGVMRHSVSHVMAQAVKRLFDDVKLGIGPAIEDGFYYDFDMEHALSPDDLPRIEEEMNRIKEENQEFERSELSREEALELLSREGEFYKQELVRDLREDRVSFYRNGEFTDMCRGPHVSRTGQIGEFKLLSVAGAYWRGNETKPMLQRIYGVCFETREELDKHLAFLEEVKNRDHRRLGKALDFFSIDPDVGLGLVLWHPKGALVRHVVEDFWRREHLGRGYDLVYTPHIASERIYELSGHLENYQESMFGSMDVEGKPYRVKPMNCPGHIKIFKSRARSYRDLPIRYAELGTVYRYERSGTLQGMLRVRGFTQDDAHIFCTPEQLPDEIEKILDLADHLLKAFGYEYEMFLATRPEKYLGSEEEWDRATDVLRSALERRGAAYEVDEGGGIFYGPKIDLKLRDAIGREWQGPTIQVDLNLPKRFDLMYVGPDGAEHQVVIVHRTVLGSMERFVGGLLEHYAGAFPAWLAPEQVRVITISDAHAEYARTVAGQLAQHGIRVETDLRNEKTGFKIRAATLDKVPYVLVVGDREVSGGTVAVRSREDGDLGPSSVEAFLHRIASEIESKS